MIVTVEHFDSEVTQPRFMAFLHHHNVKIGEEIELYRYMIWAHRQANNLKTEKSIDRLTDLDHKKLDDHLLEPFSMQQTTIFDYLEESG
ncbi:hypothetical protein AB1K91_05170 [Terribacillus sp. 179-K 1B1 HS]|uniref:hypothetical protein n=1 Tax=Terribacillus sp. 179-K 1B1 HS TaxID=3142388 RepID=UPI0039A14BA5